MQDMMGRLKLTANEAKTRVCRFPAETFDFLGYTFRRCWSPKTGRSYIGMAPAKKRVQRVCKSVSELTGRNQVLQEAEAVVARLNRLLRGWSNYFCLGSVSAAYKAVDSHVRRRLRQWLCVKHGLRWPGTQRFPHAYINDGLGLVRLPRLTRNFPWAKA